MNRVLDLQQNLRRHLMNRRPPPMTSNKGQHKKMQGFSPSFSKPAHPNSHAMQANTLIQMKLRKAGVKGSGLQPSKSSLLKKQFQRVSQQHQGINQENVRKCTLYKMLEREIAQLSKYHEEEIERMKQIRQQRKKESEQLNKQQFNIKLQIWQLKNEINEIKELIQDQQFESERFLQQIRPRGLLHIRGALGDASTSEEMELTINRQQSPEIQQESE